MWMAITITKKSGKTNLMKTVLEKVSAADVQLDPFPHIVIDDAFDEVQYLQMERKYPSHQVLIQNNARYPGNDPGNNKRFGLMGIDILQDSRLDPIWSDFVRSHTDRKFFLQVLDVFEQHFLDINPDLKDWFGPLRQVKPGLRYVNTFDDAPILLDATIVINSPVVKEQTTVRRPHVDRLCKLYSGLCYLRDPADESSGGELLLYRFKSHPPCGFDEKREITEEHIECAKRIPYRRNTLVMFPHSINALHGVSVRSLTDFPRRLLTFSCDTYRNLYDISPHQVGGMESGCCFSANERLIDQGTG